MCSSDLLTGGSLAKGRADLVILLTALKGQIHGIAHFVQMQEHQELCLVNHQLVVDLPEKIQFFQAGLRGGALGRDRLNHEAHSLGNAPQAGKDRFGRLDRKSTRLNSITS